MVPLFSQTNGKSVSLRKAEHKSTATPEVSIFKRWTEHTGFNLTAYCIITRARCNLTLTRSTLAASRLKHSPPPLGYLQGLFPTRCCIRARNLKSACACCHWHPHGERPQHLGPTFGSHDHVDAQNNGIRSVADPQTDGETCRSSSHSSSSR